MSLMNLLFGTKTIFGAMGVAAIELDALLNETTVMSSQITEYPVEDGTIISDHITLDSERLTVPGRYLALKQVRQSLLMPRKLCENCIVRES